MTTQQEHDALIAELRGLIRTLARRNQPDSTKWFPIVSWPFWFFVALFAIYELVNR